MVEHELLAPKAFNCFVSTAEFSFGMPGVSAPFPCTFSQTLFV
jgi:hypothetical protein